MKSFLVVLLLLVSALFQTSFNPGEKKPLVVPKPVNDFSWLKTYYSIYATFDQDQWEKNTTRSFDSMGVHLSGGKNHPVNACHYALFCYDEYKATGVDRFKKAFIAQVSYLRDSTKYVEVDSNKVGYPYRVNFHDLKDPWFSALAQSEAISVLIRYYALTKDKTILPLIVKLRNFMVAAAGKDFGTMTHTPEGNIWFEEYPNSNQERQVLNGFFLALVALHEYIQLFPDDNESKMLLDSSMIAAKASIKFYDTGTWLKYNRGDQRLVANGYMKWQTNEMLHLWKLTDDVFFKNLHMLWASYGYMKDYETLGCKVSTYNWAVPCSIDSKGWLSMVSAKQKAFDEKQILRGNSYPSSRLEKNLLMETNQLPWKFTVTDTMTDRPFIHYQLKNVKAINEVEIITSDTLNKNEVTLFYKEKKEDKNYVTVKVKKLNKTANGFSFQLKSIKATEIKLSFNFKTGRKATIKSTYFFYNDIRRSVPEFGFYTSAAISLPSTKFSFEFEKRDIDNFIIFYRYGKDVASCLKNPWQFQNVVTDTNAVQEAGDSSKYIQYKIIFNALSLSSAIKNPVLKMASK